MPSGILFVASPSARCMSVDNSAFSLSPRLTHHPLLRDDPVPHRELVLLLSSKGWLHRSNIIPLQVGSLLVHSLPLPRISFVFFLRSPFPIIHVSRMLPSALYPIQLPLLHVLDSYLRALLPNPLLPLPPARHHRRILNRQLN